MPTHKSLPIMLRRPQPRLLQALQIQLRVTRDQSHLEIPRDGHQRCLELVVVDVVGRGRLRLAGHDAVHGDDAHEGGVDEPGGGVLARAGARARAKGEVLHPDAGFLGRGRGTREPALRIEGGGVGAEVVDV